MPILCNTKSVKMFQLKGFLNLGLRDLFYVWLFLIWRKEWKATYLRSQRIRFTKEREHNGDCREISVEETNR